MFLFNYDQALSTLNSYMIYNVLKSENNLKFVSGKRIEVPCPFNGFDLMTFVMGKGEV